MFEIYDKFTIAHKMKKENKFKLLIKKIEILFYISRNLIKKISLLNSARIIKIIIRY